MSRYNNGRGFRSAETYGQMQQEMADTPATVRVGGGAHWWRGKGAEGGLMGQSFGQASAQDLSFRDIDQNAWASAAATIDRARNAWRGRDERGRRLAGPQGVGGVRGLMSPGYTPEAMAGAARGWRDYGTLARESGGGGTLRDRLTWAAEEASDAVGARSRHLAESAAAAKADKRERRLEQLDQTIQRRTGGARGYTSPPSAATQDDWVASRAPEPRVEQGSAQSAASGIRTNWEPGRGFVPDTDFGSLRTRKGHGNFVRNVTEDRDTGQYRLF